MTIKLSDYILEQSISDASPNDIILEELIAQMDVYQALFNVYEKERLIQEAITANLPPQNPTSIVQSYDDRPTSSAADDSGIDEVIIRHRTEQSPDNYDIHQIRMEDHYIIYVVDKTTDHNVYSITIPSNEYLKNKDNILKNVEKHMEDYYKDKMKDPDYMNAYNRNNIKSEFNSAKNIKNFERHYKPNLNQGFYLWQLLFLISGICIYYVGKHEKEEKEEKRRVKEELKAAVEKEIKDKEDVIKRKKIISLYYEIININQDVINTNDLSESFQADIVKRYKSLAEQLINSDTSVEKIGKMQSEIDSNYTEIAKLKNIITRPDTKEKLIANYNKFNSVNAKSIIESFNSIKSSLTNIK